MNRIIEITRVLFAVLACWGPAQAQTHFTEVATLVGVSDSQRPIVTNSPSWGDFDNDGWLDVYVGSYGIIQAGRVTSEGVQLIDSVLAVAPRLYHNNRDGSFTDVAVWAGVADTAVSIGGSWLDYDNNGFLDLFQFSGTQAMAGLNTWVYHNSGNGTFADVYGRTALAVSLGGGSFTFADYNNDGWLDLYLVHNPTFDTLGTADLANSIPNQLYRSNRDGTFTDVAALSGVVGYGNGGMWGDDDDDGDLDFYMPSQPGYPNPSQLYRNNGDGTFTDVASSAGVGDVGDVQPISVAWGDYNNDGLLDLYRINNYTANNLFRNNGDGTFTDMAARAGVADDKLGYGVGGSWGDYDNDGFLDLYVSNVASSSPCRLFHNNGDGTFTDLGIEAGVNRPDGLGAAWGDYDRDGFLDLFVCVWHLDDGGAMVAAPNLLFHNEGNSNHYLVLQFKGTISNRDAIGAKVVAVTGTTRQRRDVESAGSGWGSQPSLPVEFGFGSVAVVDSLIIRWPSGIVQVMTQVPTDQYLTLAESRESEPTAVLEEQLTSLPGALSLSQNYPNPFNSQTVIRFALPASAEMELGVYDLAGQQVALLVAGMREAGTYSVSWDGRDERGQELASGTYLYRLRVGEREETRKLALVR